VVPRYIIGVCRIGSVHYQALRQLPAGGDTLATGAYPWTSTKRPPAASTDGAATSRYRTELCDPAHLAPNRGCHSKMKRGEGVRYECARAYTSPDRRKTQDYRHMNRLQVSVDPHLPMPTLSCLGPLADLVADARTQRWLSSYYYRLYLNKLCAAVSKLWTCGLADSVGQPETKVSWQTTDTKVSLRRAPVPPPTAVDLLLLSYYVERRRYNGSCDRAAHCDQR